MIGSDYSLQTIPLILTPGSVENMRAEVRTQISLATLNQKDSSTNSPWSLYKTCALINWKHTAHIQLADH